MISFSWDDRKNEANKKKRGVSFDEAKTVFYDENAIRYFDPDHSDDEDRVFDGGCKPKAQNPYRMTLLQRRRFGHKDYFSQKRH
jgi:uncharacterized DUF497 family protein